MYNIWCVFYKKKLYILKLNMAHRKYYHDPQFGNLYTICRYVHVTTKINHLVRARNREDIPSGTCTLPQNNRTRTVLSISLNFWTYVHGYWS